MTKDMVFNNTEVVVIDFKVEERRHYSVKSNGIIKMHKLNNIIKMTFIAQRNIKLLFIVRSYNKICNSC